ncbi:tyrosine-type recombinase/integrase [Aneurinibacillus sp. Ricciae_BoGa-3]|uniref:tyrosine-type recombinase/integrase n=1 Tax=Aneurinibacillus sp. Ricciae_BoGa-3 TaxID=3022697 RepID=UPI002341870D|nr:tyrosine-type recombinase/integrase [Aneurinibacillus sp. Ricciae_BoGa-3]WCK56567.1 tyrosine-type recombinase/integrase [Aneurinibacillus sp. Ricciae_BoGa-3]
MESIIEDYREYQTIIRGYTPKVVKATWRELKKLAQYLENLSINFQNVQLVHLENYCIERTESKSLGYRNVIISQLRSFFNYLVQQEFRLENPARHLRYTNLDLYQSLPEIASIEEIQDCLKELKRQIDSCLSRRQFDPIRKRNLALFALLYASGIRAGEAANLQIRDILWEEQVLIIREGKGRKERRVPVVNEILELLQIYLATRNDLEPNAPLFLTWRKEAMDNNLIGATFRKYHEMWEKSLRPHQLRHICASHLYQQGGNIVQIKDWLGHKRLTTTLHYTRIQNPEIEATLESHPINEMSCSSKPKLEIVNVSSQNKPLRRKYTMTPIAEPLTGKLAEQIQEFLRTAEGMKKYSKGTLKEFRFSLTRFAVGCPHCLEKGIEVLRAVDIIRWLSARRQAGISPCTIDKNLSHLRSFMAYAIDRGWRTENPMEALKMVPKQPKEQTYLTEEEMLRILSAPDRSTNQGFTDFITLLVLYATGLRVGELSALNIEDVDLKEGWIHVREGKSGDRQTAIPKAAIGDLKKYVGLYRKAKSGPFLLNQKGTRIKPWTITRRIRKYSEAAHIEKPVSPHTIRHTFTAHLIQRGGRVEVIAKALGHKSLKETTPYAHADFEDIRKAVSLLRRNIPPVSGEKKHE